MIDACLLPMSIRMPKGERRSFSPMVLKNDGRKQYNIILFVFLSIALMYGSSCLVPLAIDNKPFAAQASSILPSLFASCSIDNKNSKVLKTPEGLRKAPM
uniref:Uncharacterized protein n=1 Tax=Opuntia streptacantha TaxID=393608 RepID=A0A7C9DG52_OPUST